MFNLNHAWCKILISLGALDTGRMGCLLMGHTDGNYKTLLLCRLKQVLRGEISLEKKKFTLQYECKWVVTGASIASDPLSYSRTRLASLCET